MLGQCICFNVFFDGQIFFFSELINNICIRDPEYLNIECDNGNIFEYFYKF